MITKIIKLMICVSDRSILGILNAITVLLYILEKLLSVGITFALHFQRVFSLHTHMTSLKLCLKDLKWPFKTKIVAPINDYTPMYKTVCIHVSQKQGLSQPRQMTMTFSWQTSQ